MSLFKWVGSKRRIVDDITAYFPEKCDTYHEPFLGSGHVGFRCIELGMADNYIFSDTNNDLISFWVSMRDHLDDLLESIENRGRSVSKRVFIETRLETPKTIVQAGSRFYYLIKLCYKGLWRENNSGMFNVAYNPEVKNYKPDTELFLKYNELLQGVKIEHMDWRDAVKDADRGDVYYLDPPYWGTFSGYSKGGFDQHEHVVMAAKARDIRRRGGIVFISNIDCAQVRDLYRGRSFIEIPVMHSASRNGPELKNEVLIY